MNRNELILASLAPSGGRFHTPVQIQKLLFLIDRSAGDKVGGPHFDFQPYDYGPFDKDVYSVVEALTQEGLIQAADTGRSWKKFALTAKGQSAGDAALAALDEQTRVYLQKLSACVLSLSFTQLVSAIYKAFPDMRVNSVFRV